MKKILALTFMTLFLIASIAMVSADVAQYKTLIAGKIYDSANFEDANPVADATVYVTCNNITKTATSKIDGTYSVEYAPEEGCYDIEASAYATLGDVTSDTMTADVQDYTENFDLYLGVINIALIPEFGVFVGALTLMGAVGVFFLIRRK
ncbi:MAG: hypothetical protein PHH54_01090 [Candidatus Nanoarchaeia archaeon]|nr:hypothetical protein [Candidatus Nanoarchaeia archaeon]MDD5740559.1 hypothetical protein [Candidatus Nanoarchaeia archaeon]